MSQDSTQVARTIPQAWDAFFSQQSSTQREQKVLFAPEQLRDKYSYKEINALARCLAAYLISQGLRPGDSVLVVSSSLPVYLCYDLGIQLAGGINVTVSRHQSLAVLEQVVRDCRPTFVLLADYSCYKMYQQWYDSQPALRTIVKLYYGQDMDETDRALNLENVVEMGKIFWRENKAACAQREQDVQPASPATTIYYRTSRRGELQAITLSQQNLMAALAACATYLPKGPQLPVQAYQTYATALERVAGLYAPFLAGHQLHFNPSLHALRQANRRGKPFVLSIGASVLGAYFGWAVHQQQQRGLLARKLLEKGLAAARRATVLRATRKPVPAGLSIGLWWYRQLVLRGFYKKYFSRMKYIIAGLDVLDETLLLNLQALKAPVLAALPLEQAGGMICAERLTSRPPGAAGRLVQGLEGRTDGSNGLLWVRGAMVAAQAMQGNWAHTHYSGSLQDGIFFADGLRNG